MEEYRQAVELRSADRWPSGRPPSGATSGATTGTTGRASGCGSCRVARRAPRTVSGRVARAVARCALELARQAVEIRPAVRRRLSVVMVGITRRVAGWRVRSPTTAALLGAERQTRKYEKCNDDHDNRGGEDLRCFLHCVTSFHGWIFGRAAESATKS